MKKKIGIGMLVVLIGVFSYLVFLAVTEGLSTMLVIHGVIAMTVGTWATKSLLKESKQDREGKDNG